MLLPQTSLPAWNMCIREAEGKSLAQCYPINFGVDCKPEDFSGPGLHKRTIVSHLLFVCSSPEKRRHFNVNRKTN